MRNSNSYSLSDCYVKLDENLLIAGNDLIERKWLLTENGFFAISLFDKATGTEWLKRKTNPTEGALSIFAWSASGCSTGQMKYETLNAVQDDDFGVGAPHLKAEVIIRSNSLDLKLELRVYSQIPVIRSMIYIKYENNQLQTAVLNEQKSMFSAASEDMLDFLPLDTVHCKWNTAAFRAFTDTNNNLVSEEHGLLFRQENRWLQGNILFLKQTFAENGLTIIKEAPNAREHTNYPGGDFFMKGSDILVTGTGLGLECIGAGEYIPAFGSAVCLWTGEEYNALLALKAYFEACHRFESSRDCSILSNTWGDRSMGNKLSEAFILEELEAAKKIGITHYQIDEGWQENDGQPYGYDYNWAIKPSFPNEFYPISKKAEELGIKLGLWFRPYTPDDYAAWEKDADTIINFHKKFGFVSFKLDGFRVLTLRGDLNFAQMLRKVLKATDNKVNFNIDITNEKRVGYFRSTQYGNLFLENRYTDWNGYYPHFTLRNLWQLSRYYPTYKLQMEFLNTDRNIDKYQGDPLAPYVCGMEYAFAVTMFSNPLAWFEPSCLSAENAAKLKRIISVYRKYQGDILSGQVLPIGQEPDGTSWTGFQSIKDSEKGYLLVIREKNNKPKGKFKLWGNREMKSVKLELLAGQGFSGEQCTADGTLDFELDKPFSFGLYSYRL